MSTPKLYSYWRSTASYRVRLALGLKGIDYEQQAVDLKGGAQLEVSFAAINPQAQIPVLDIDGARLHQSVAIIDYLEATRSEVPLLPADPQAAAQARAFALTIAADIHPIQNLRVLKYVKREFGQDQAGVDAWAKHWIALGFAALEAMASPRGTAYAFSDDAPGYAECFLVPQAYNAERFGVDMAPFPTLRAIADRCADHPAFVAAHPQRQPDAPPQG